MKPLQAERGAISSERFEALTNLQKKEEEDFVKKELEFEYHLSAVPAADAGRVSETSSYATPIPDAPVASTPTAPESIIPPDRPREPMSSSVSTPQFTWGLQKPFPRHLMRQLEEWHAQSDSPPPFSDREIRAPKYKWKVFSRDGEELQVTTFFINQQPEPYHVLVVHFPGGVARIVSGMKMGRWYTFFLTWTGMKDGYEPRISAVKIAAKYEDVKFSPHLLSHEARDSTTFSFVTSTRYTAPANRHEAEGARTSEQDQPSHNGTSQGPEANDNHGARARTSSHREDSIPNDNNNEDTAQQSRHAKRPRLDNHGSNAGRESMTDVIGQGSTTDTGREPTADTGRVSMTEDRTVDIVFRLVSEGANAARCFTLRDCNTGHDLFKKAQEFFGIIHEGIDIKALICQVPSQRERRYLFAGNEGEFSLLVDDVKRLNLGNSGPLTIEIRRVV